MPDFHKPDSIMRTIWGNSDTILLVFSGAAAEFALNRAVDWLFFTGKIPNDPIGRLFSTARFAQEMVFADAEQAQQTLERVAKIHASVERQRGDTIPAWSHRDVLYLLMDYTARSYEMLHRPLTDAEHDEMYEWMIWMGRGLEIPDLPSSYDAWQIDRKLHLEQDLIYSDYTAALYAAYRAHLGPWRYDLLLQTQALLVPEHVRDLLQLKPRTTLLPTPWAYQTLARLGLRPLVQRLLLPPRLLTDVRQLDRPLAA